jgi:uroporphyrinogen-III decarboxylase
VSKTPQQLYEERLKRVSDAIALKKPDRIPVFGGSGRYGSERLGISSEEQMRDIGKALEVSFQETLYFEPDLGGFASLYGALGHVLGPLGFKQLKWAGHGLSANAGTPMWVEAECMSADEYDELIYDPSDFVARKYLPRAYEKLAVFAALNPIREAIDWFGAPAALVPLGTPEGLQALDALRQAAQAAQEIAAASKGWTERLKQAGFPLFLSSMPSSLPFDYIGDYLRGRKGVMLDMYRRPEKLLRACEKLLPMTIERFVRGARESGSSRVMFGPHGCDERLMSLQQFQKFFWPAFRELLVALVKEGLEIMILLEGGSTSHLDILSDVPAVGKICYWFEQVDMARAKKILGDKVCIAGNVPLSLLATGTPEDVRAYCKKLIDIMGKEGGYILGPSGGTDDARVENVKAMIGFTKEYGVC